MRTSSETAKIRKALAAEYGKGTPLPVARKRVESRLHLVPGSAISFDRVYFELIGVANPLPVSPDATRGEINAAIRARRNGTDGATVANEGATKGLGLRRWETVAASATVALGRKVSVADARLAYGKRETYVGKGTKAGAPSKRHEPSIA